MNTRKVILWGREDLLGRSMEIFLSTRDEWEVIRLNSEQNDDYLLAAIEQEKPDVVLLYLNCNDVSGALPLQLIQCYPGLKVISLNLGSNEIEVYHKQTHCINAISDLLGVVEG